MVSLVTHDRFFISICDYVQGCVCWCVLCVHVCMAIYISVTFIHICPCHPGDILGHYMVYFSVEIICKPAAPVRVIDVQCASGVSYENILVLNQI